MSDVQAKTTAQFRWMVYGLLLATAVGSMIGRLWNVKSALGETPLLSANDRSRWATVRALGDHGTFALDDVIFLDRRQTKRNREWYSIDMVRHRGADGAEHYYSSKPPLPTLMVAAAYWGLRQATGATLAEQPFYVVRCLLALVNIVPLAIYLGLMFCLLERYGRTDWGRLFVAAAAAYGTFLTTFAVTLNNHVWAAVSAAAALYAALAIWCDGRRQWRYFVLAGLCAAFAVVNELPALSFCALLGAALMIRSPVRCVVGFVPAAGLVAAAFFAANYWAHGAWRPPYAHRGDGPRVAAIADDHRQQIEAGEIPAALRQAMADAGIDLSPQAVLQPRWSGEGWMIWDPADQHRWAVSADARSVEVFAWDNWYEYEKSYWLPSHKKGVDLGEPSRLKYAFHVIVGHHGVLSLTPIWLLSVLGAGVWLARGSWPVRQATAGVVLITLVCLAFYLARPLMDRNYGGVACGFRWMFWFAPMWLWVMLGATDAIAARRSWRCVALALLLVSVSSAAYASLNPWSHPWLYQYCEFLGWTP